jgi:hypothetical protein
VLLVSVVAHDGAGGRGEVDPLEQGCWSGGDEYIVICNIPARMTTTG